MKNIKEDFNMPLLKTVWDYESVVYSMEDAALFFDELSKQDLKGYTLEETEYENYLNRLLRYAIENALVDDINTLFDIIPSMQNRLTDTLEKLANQPGVDFAELYKLNGKYNMNNKLNDYLDSKLFRNLESIENNFDLFLKRIHNYKIANYDELEDIFNILNKTYKVKGISHLRDEFSLLDKKLLESMSSEKDYNNAETTVKRFELHHDLLKEVRVDFLDLLSVQERPIFYNTVDEKKLKLIHDATDKSNPFLNQEGADSAEAGVLLDLIYELSRFIINVRVDVQDELGKQVEFKEDTDKQTEYMEMENYLTILLDSLMINKNDFEKAGNIQGLLKLNDIYNLLELLLLDPEYSECLNSFLSRSERVTDDFLKKIAIFDNREELLENFKIYRTDLEARHIDRREKLEADKYELFCREIEDNDRVSHIKGTLKCIYYLAERPYNFDILKEELFDLLKPLLDESLALEMVNLLAAVAIFIEGNKSEVVSSDKLLEFLLHPMMLDKTIKVEYELGQLEVELINNNEEFGRLYYLLDFYRRLEPVITKNVTLIDKLDLYIQEADEKPYS